MANGPPRMPLQQLPSVTNAYASPNSSPSNQLVK